MRPRSLPGLLAALALFGSAAGSAPPVRVERQAYVMGTRISLVTYDASRARALDRLESFLRVVEDAEEELSTWRRDSVLSTFNRAPIGRPFTVSPSLCRMFEQVWRWSAATGGRFDPAVGSLVDAWGVREGGRAAAARDVSAALARSGLSRIAFDAARCSLTRSAAVELDAGAFGKGEALGRIAALTADARDPWLVDLGGQVAVHGHPPGQQGWNVDVAHPRARSEPVLTLTLEGGSLATSGGSERDVRAGGRRISHVVDPRSGRPAAYGGSVTVWHADALAADALSTALLVMGPDEGLAWADGQDIAACFLDAGAEGLQARASRAFRARFAACDPAAGTGASPAGAPGTSGVRSSELRDQRFLKSPQVSISDP